MLQVPLTNITKDWRSEGRHRDGCNWRLYQAVYAYTGGRYRKTRGSVITLISNIYTSFTTGPWPPVTRGPPTQLSALVTHCVHALLDVASQNTFGAIDALVCDRKNRPIARARARARASGVAERINADRFKESFLDYPRLREGEGSRERWKWWYSPYSRCRYLATGLPSSSLLLFIARSRSFPRDHFVLYPSLLRCWFLAWQLLFDLEFAL